MAKPKHIHRAGRIDEIPPYCFMKPGMSPEEGTRAAIRALGITHPLDVLVMLWTLRRASSVEQAEQQSAQSAAETPVTTAIRSGYRRAAHIPTHKHPINITLNACAVSSTALRSVITPGHRGKTEPAREEKEKDALKSRRERATYQQSKGRKA